MKPPNEFELCDNDQQTHRIMSIKEEILRTYRDTSAEQALVASPEGSSPEVRSAKIIHRTRRNRVQEVKTFEGFHALAFVAMTAVSFEVALSLPGMAKSNGGMYFFLAMEICLLFLVAPLACVELALGQLTAQNATGIFTDLSPIFTGIGWLIDLLRIMNSVSSRFSIDYGLALMSMLWNLLYSNKNSFCNYNDKYFVEYTPCNGLLSNRNSTLLKNSTIFFGGYCIDLSQSNQSDNYIWLKNRMLSMKIEHPNLDRNSGNSFTTLTIILALSSIIVLAAARGVSKFYKISGITVVSLLSSLLLYGFFNLLQCEYKCFDTKMISDPSVLVSLSMWSSAFATASGLVGLGDGTLHSLGRHLGFNNNIFKSTMLIIVYANLIAVICFYVVLSVTNGAFLDISVRDIYEWTVSDYILIAPFHRNVSTIMYIAVAIIIFVLIFAQLNYQVNSCDLLHKSCIQLYRCYAQLPTNITYVVSVLTYGTLLSTVVVIVDMYGNQGEIGQLTKKMVVFVVFIELLVVTGFYGTHKLLVNIKSMLHRRGEMAPVLLRFFQFFEIYLNYFVPLGVLVLLVPSIITDNMQSINFTSIFFSGSLFLVFFPMLKMFIYDHFFGHSATNILHTNVTVGPSNIECRKRLRYDEMAARLYIV